MSQSDVELLKSFLSLPLSGADSVFEELMSIPGVIYRGQGQERFLYISGWRRNKVVLVSHADTYRDGSIDVSHCRARELTMEGDEIRSAELGIGQALITGPDALSYGC